MALPFLLYWISYMYSFIRNVLKAMMACLDRIEGLWKICSFRTLVKFSRLLCSVPVPANSSSKSYNLIFFLSLIFKRGFWFPRNGKATMIQDFEDEKQRLHFRFLSLFLHPFSLLWVSLLTLSIPFLHFLFKYGRGRGFSRRDRKQSSLFFSNFSRLFPFDSLFPSFPFFFWCLSELVS